ISNFTIEQKVNVSTGVGWMNGLCVGNIPAVGEFPGLCLQDSPLGVRYTDYVTSFPAGITTASTFNRALMRARGLAIGQENRDKGVNVALGPMMNMGRIAQGGRNWEGFGADPFLSGEAAHETILGMQAGGVQATAKHYINNEQEWKRTQESSNVDDRTEHEIYGQPFMRAVMADEDYPKSTIDSWNAYDPMNQEVNAQSNHYEVVRQIAAGGTILLKNNGVLPLDKPGSIVLVGSDAAPPTTGPNEYVDQGGDPSGILAMGWGSGTDNFTYLISPYEAIQARARLDQTSVFWDFDDWDLSKAGNSVIDKTVAIVFVNSDSGEGYITVDGNAGDRQNLTAWHQGDELILAVAAQNNNTIVVTNSVGPLILEPWVEHPNVTAILWASLGGNEAGNGIMDVLYGNWNPSGRLPYTIAKTPMDYPAQPVFGGTAADILSINYTEGLFIDYRWFDAQNITPRYEFGFGLSYTTFEYSNVAVTPIAPLDWAETSLVDNWQNGGASPIAEGSTTALWLHMPAFQVTFNVKNTGSRYGGEIPQLYLHHDASAMEPPSILKGFTNIELEPGQTGQASITLSRYDLSIWDVVRQGWAKPSGTITFSVGASSRDFRLNGTIPC
ncbi:glycoside hydrolase family 3 protein, partial [Hydnomerulius pinastri MD-312]